MINADNSSLTSRIYKSPECSQMHLEMNLAFLTVSNTSSREEIDDLLGGTGWDVNEFLF